MVLTIFRILASKTLVAPAYSALDFRCQESVTVDQR